MYFAHCPFSLSRMRSDTVYKGSVNLGAHLPADAVNLWSKEARGARRGAGMLGQHLGYRTLTAPHARAARAARLRPQGLARPRPAADIRVPCPLLLLCSCCSTDAHPAAAMTAAAGSRRCSSSKFSRACGARASLRACGVRGRRCPERACGAPASKKSLFPVREYATEGSPGDKKFLLHQSTALDELYPTVPLSQIVTRGKYFILKMNLYASCTNTLRSVAFLPCSNALQIGKTIRASLSIAHSSDA